MWRQRTNNSPIQAEKPVSLYRLAHACAMLSTEGDVMRFGSASFLASACFLGVAGCSSDMQRPTFDNETENAGQGGSGNGGSSGQSTVGKSGTGGAATIGVPTSPTGNGTKAVPDDDPSNPNITHPTCDLGTCKDFPSDPIKGDGVPDNVGDLFGNADNMQSGSLCVVEPQLSNGDKPGAMIPANWVRPRIRVDAPSNIDLFEIRIHSEAEANDLVAYTKQKSWYLPKEIWAGDTSTQAAGSAFANNGAGKPVTVTVRGVNSKSPSAPIGMKGDFNIAPVVATGSMVFWTVNSALVTLK